MAGIGIILNPHSRSNRRNPGRVQRLGFIVGDKGSCHATHDILDVARIAAEFKERQIDILGISGGDGTNHVTLTTVLKAYGDTPLPKIALLRGGTMNNVANTLGIKGTPEQILANLIRKYNAGESFKTAELDSLCVNGDYGFLFGMGVPFRFMVEYYKFEGSPVLAGLMLARCITSFIFRTPFVYDLFERFDADVQVNGKPWPFKNYAILHAGTVETYGLGFNPLVRAREQPGHMHVIGFSAPPLGLCLALPNIFMNRPSKCADELSELSQHVVIDCPKPQGYFVDGDIKAATTHIDLSCGPRLTFIVN